MSSYDMIATKRLDLTGAVHASGECYVTVERQHGGDSPAVSARGSVHHMGHSSVDVEEFRPKSNALPEPVDKPEGFASMMKGELRERGDVHEAGTLRVHIGRLVVMKKQDAGMVVALHDAGYDVYDEISLRGSVHSNGTLKVTIEDLYVYE